MSTTQIATLICLQFAIYSFCWLVLSVITKTTNSSIYWFLYNISQAASFALFGGLTWFGELSLPLGIVFGILGYHLSSIGIDHFLHGKVMFQRFWLFYGGLGVLLLIAGLYTKLPVLLIISLNIPAILYCLSAVFFFRKKMVAEFGKIGIASLIPGTTYGVFLLISTSYKVINFDSIQKAVEPTSRFPLYFVVLLIVGILNTIFFTLYISRMLRQMRELATIDSLTSVFNRRAFTTQFELALSRSERHQTPITVAFIDIDHFKRINDRGGHDLGDHALVAVARIIKNSIRNVDILGRWGGEEFVLLIPDTNIEGAQIAIERIHNNIKLESILPSTEFEPLTVSIGLASNAENLKLTQEELIKHADLAMYRAKESGRNCTRVFNPTSFTQ